jgi:hypothetical protein
MYSVSVCSRSSGGDWRYAAKGNTSEIRVESTLEIHCKGFLDFDGLIPSRERRRTELKIQRYKGK